MYIFLIYKVWISITFVYLTHFHDLKKCISFLHLKKDAEHSKNYNLLQVSYEPDNPGFIAQGIYW